MHRVVLSLGCNDGDRAAAMIAMENGVKGVLSPPYLCSSLMETEPVDVATMQQSYYNRIFCGYFTGEPDHLLEQCQYLECKLGRTGKNCKLPRTADIDILLFDDVLVHTINLTIPHPQIFSRRFCIEGLYEIIPEWRIPESSLTVCELYDTMDYAVKRQGVVKIAPGYTE